MPALVGSPPLDTTELRKRYAAGQPFTEREWRLLASEAEEKDPKDAGLILGVHDLLLFVKAFPRNAPDRARAVEGLDRIAEVAARSTAKSRKADRALEGSGIAGTSIRARFSIDLCRWLCSAYPDTVRLEALEGEEDAVRNVFQCLTGRIEREAMDDTRHEVLARLIDASAGRPLPWLVRAIDGATPDPRVRHALWESCGPLITVDPGRSPLSRTHAHGLEERIHSFPHGTRSPVNTNTTIKRPMAQAIKLGARQQRILIAAARGVLVGHQRETDPMTMGEPGAVRYHRMGSGIGVALLTLPPERRPAFDAYVGYMAFVNGVPVAYGGAWLFPGKTKVGINVFPAFRGGPSQLIYAQVLRCYAQRYGVHCFEAENYQLGHGNSDGIRSGAYWFYYRMGFRTVDPRLAAIAGTEAQRMREQPGYRTPPAVLRKLAAEPMVLRLRSEGAPTVELLDLSERMLHRLASLAQGDRRRAGARILDRVSRELGVDRVMAHWPASERAAFIDLAPAVDAIADLHAWTSPDKRALVQVMRAKGRRREDHYLELLGRHARLLHAWAELVAVG